MVVRGQPAQRIAGGLLVVEGTLLAILAVWNGASWLPSMHYPELVVAVIVVFAALLGVLVLGCNIAMRGAVMLRSPEPHSRVAAALAMQIPVLCVVLVFSILIDRAWLAGLGAALVVPAAALLATRSS